MTLIRKAWGAICAASVDLEDMLSVRREDDEPESSEDPLDGLPDLGSIEDHYRDNGAR